MDWQTIKWKWDLDERYVKTYYNSERIVIDVKEGKMYNSWGEYLDNEMAISSQNTNDSLTAIFEFYV